MSDNTTWNDSCRTTSPTLEVVQRQEVSLPPWEEIEIPEGYLLTKSGVYAENAAGRGDKQRIEQKKIASPSWVKAYCVSLQKDNLGIMICWLDQDGDVRQSAVPHSRLYDKALIADLSLAGLRTVPGREQLMLRYLGSFEPTERIENVSSLGWIGMPGVFGFMLPSGAKIKVDRPIVFQPERNSQVASRMQGRGCLDDWKENVAGKCSGSNMLTFALCVSLAAPLLKAAALDSGGFNLHGDSSHGKTTTLQAAASVWGSGADPAEEPENSFIYKWNSTGNGLEGIAANHNDGLLCLDELGTSGIKDFGKVIYDLTGGKGKNALNSDRSQKPSRTWRVFIFSSGEISSQQKLEEDNKASHAGQLLRMIDLPFPEKLFKTECDTGRIVDALKRACAESYGTAGRAFVQYLVENWADFDSLRSDIKQRLESATTRIIGAKQLNKQQTRAAKKFALVLVSGEMAVAAKILDFETSAIFNSVAAAFNSWLASVPTLRDDERGIEAVREYILRHQSSRIPKLHSDTEKIVNQAGYFDDKTYFLFESAFKEACAPLDYKGIAKELKRRGLLKIDRTDRLSCRLTVNGEQLKCYGVKAAIISADIDNVPAVGESSPDKTDISDTMQ